MYMNVYARYNPTTEEFYGPPVLGGWCATREEADQLAEQNVSRTFRRTVVVTAP